MPFDQAGCWSIAKEVFKRSKSAFVKKFTSSDRLYFIFNLGIPNIFVTTLKNIKRRRV